MTDTKAMIQHAFKTATNPKDIDWPDPLPIKAELLPVAPFEPEKLLPEEMREWVMDAADRMPCPPDYIAAAVLVSIGSIIGARVVIKPKRFDDWMIVPNLWGGIVGLPSAKKSPAISAAFKPLDHLIVTAAANYKEACAEHENGKVIREAKLAAYKSEMKRAAAKEIKEDYGDEIEKDNETTIEKEATSEERSAQYKV